MDFSWSAREQELISEAEGFAEDQLAGRRSDGLDLEAWRKCGDAGWLGMPLPREWGGAEASLTTTAAVFEALGRGGADRGLLFAMGAHLFGCALPLARLGGDGLKKAWGTKLASGEAIAALAITEPQGGSNPAGMQATALREDRGDYRLRGEKTLVSNASDAAVFLLIASEIPARGSMGLSAFLLPADLPGLEVEPIPSTLGLPGAPVGRLELSDCVVEEGWLLGKRQAGLSVLLSAMQYERSCLLAGFLGAAERDFKRCLRRCRQRQSGGQPLVQHQGVSRRLARIKVLLEGARLMLYRGAWAIDQGEGPLLQPSLVKYSVSEALVEISDNLLRLYAGAGWCDEDGVATAHRDVLGCLSASGTSEVQLNVIASALES